MRNFIRKNQLVEAVAWLIIVSLVATGWYSWHRVTSWSSAQADALAPEIAPAVNAVNAAFPPVTEGDGGGVEVVIEPSGVQYMTFGDGRERAFGDASFYDYDLDSDGRGFTCPSRGSKCYTHGKMIAASRHFRRYSSVRVTNLNNGKFVDVKILDFGPSEEEFPERVIDLSSSAFAAIADLNAGIIAVRVDWPVP